MVVVVLRELLEPLVSFWCEVKSTRRGESCWAVDLMSTGEGGGGSLLVGTYSET
jgi:hypothetical protein